MKTNKFSLNIGIALTLFSVSLVSCKKDYLNTSPTDQIATSTVFQTTTNAWAALNGIHRYLYSQMFSNQDQGGESGNMLYMDLMGEDLVMTAQANGWLISTYKWQTYRIATSTVSTYNYLFYYIIIGNANMIIANIDNATGSDRDKKTIKGQALAYRAWAYFQMVQLFGQRYDAGSDNSTLGVPLVLTPTTSITPRSTVKEVYAQINKDVDEAITLLDGYTRANKSHLNVDVANGIKARVALTQQNWDDAITYSKKARASYSLMDSTSYFSGFNDYTNGEWMWGSHQQADQTTYFYSFFAYMSANYNSTNIRSNPKAIFSRLYSQITSTDYRKKLWDSTGKNKSFPVPMSGSSEVGTRKAYMNRKFLVADPGSSIGDLAIMRASEMILIEAEAEARKGDYATAANTLYLLANKRDSKYKLSTNTGNNLINEIMIQRRVELWGEGFRFYDLKRTATSLDRTGGNHDGGLTGGLLTVPATQPNAWEFLIPQTEINNTNGVVVQNPI